MTDEPTRTTPRPGEKPDRNPKKAALVVLSVVVVAAGVLAVLNRDRLFVHSDVNTLPQVPQAANEQPEIIDLRVATDRIQPFSTVEIECEAIDPDDDELVYTWSVSAGEVFGEGPVVEWGSPSTEGLYRVSVTVDDGRGGTAESSMPLRVKANVAPEITNLTAAEDWIVGGSSVFVTCEVTDGDGDDIALEWSVTGGEIFGQGRAVVWLAPEEEAIHWITVVARDPYGGEAQRKLSISVSSGEPPEIVGFTVAGINTDLLFKQGEDWHIYQGRTCTITCELAQEDDTLVYEWTADFGSLVAEGPVATWTAISSKVSATIAVAITDLLGNTASASVVIHVETCPCAF